MATFTNIGVKEEYRSNEDDIIGDFFMPCFSRCTEYDRCVEYLSINMLTTIFKTYDNFRNGQAKMRLVAGHRFRPRDLDLIIVLLSKSRNPFEKRGIKDDDIKLVRRAFERGQIELKIAMTNSTVTEDSFTDKLGIFRDSHGHVVAYVSTSRSSFGTRDKLFESIDVYTSWGDATRVKKKLSIFEKLWRNKFPHVDVYDFEYVAKRGDLKYWTEWVMHE